LRSGSVDRLVADRLDYAEDNADYLAGLDENDACEPAEVPSTTAAALQALRERRAELDRLAAKLDIEARTMLVEGEPDAHPMGIGSGRKPPSYNVQTAVDATTGLIVHHEVTTEPTDNRLLCASCRSEASRRRSNGSAILIGLSGSTSRLPAGLGATGGTGKTETGDRSSASIASAWLRRNVLQLWEGKRRGPVPFIMMLSCLAGLGLGPPIMYIALQHRFCNANFRDPVVL
jgi:hypothetical protein